MQFSYELSTVLLFGMFLQSLEVFYGLAQPDFKIVERISVGSTPWLVTSMLIWLLLNQNILFSIVTSFIVNFVYRCSYIYLLKSLPQTFTLGEGSIVSQALVIFLYNCYLKLPFMTKVNSLNEKLSLLLQLGMLGVLFIVITTRILTFFRKWIWFYPLLLTVIASVCMVPIQDSPALYTLLNFTFSDLERTFITGIYIALVVIAVVAVNWQIRKNQRGSTSTRKIFHILIVLVYVPGLIFQCLLLYVASVIILAIFIVLELARVVKLYPVTEILESSIQAFIDEKDAGKIAVTPIYLLVGCSAPLWIHNSPCDLTGSSAFELLPLLSGITSIGIGDTFASIVGSQIGNHKWGNSSKSVEGTIASIIAQTGFLYGLGYLGFISLNLKLMSVCGVAVIANSLIEALTDQVDNLVLPLVTYIILTIK